MVKKTPDGLYRALVSIRLRVWTVEVREYAFNFHTDTRAPRLFHSSAASEKERFNVGPFYVRFHRIGKNRFQRLAVFAVHEVMILLFSCKSRRS